MLDRGGAKAKSALRRKLLLSTQSDDIFATSQCKHTLFSVFFLPLLQEVPAQRDRQKWPPSMLPQHLHTQQNATAQRDTHASVRRSSSQSKPQPPHLLKKK